MNKALLDTDILSEIIKRINQRVASNAATYISFFGNYTISAISVLEVVKGWRKLQREERIQQFLAEIASMEVLSFDRDTAELAGRIYADLERIGQPIGLADSMIAAIALQYNLTLVTGNLSHYQRIQAIGYDLQLDNWRT